MASDALRINNLEDIREKLLKFTGGRVLLFKDESSYIAQIVLDRPEKCNAMTGQMMVEFRDRILELEGWKEGKGLILRGNGDNFCSGGDLRFEKDTIAQDGLDMSVWMQDTLVRLQRLPLVSVCLVHGACLGGGAELSIFCDWLIAADNVKFGFVQGKIGIVTVWGGGSQLVRRIGPTKALDLLVTAKVLSAEECVKVGLVDFVQASPLDLSNTLDWLKIQLSLPRDIICSFKTIVSNAQTYKLQDALKKERDICAEFWGGSHHKETLSSNFKHKM